MTTSRKQPVSAEALDVALAAIAQELPAGNKVVPMPGAVQSEAQVCPPDGFEQLWAELEGYAQELVRSEWPLMKAVAALAYKASELEIHRLTQRQLEQILEGAQRSLRPASAAILPGGTFTVNPTPWAVQGLFRHGLNLLVGQSGAGKSRLVAACMAAWLRGDATWLGCELSGPPVAERAALIVGTDQSLEDWALTLQPVGLCERLADGRIQTHGRLTLYGLEAGMQLDGDGLASIRRWVDAHPGGMVLADSLAACLPAGIDEDKAAAARPVHALQEALGSGWGVLTHHTRKGAGKEGNLGVGAGRGSGAIDAAVSRVIGLGLIYRMENGVMVAQEADPRRELLSTKRGGATMHLIVSSDGNGFWDRLGDAADLKREERKERARVSLSEDQDKVMAALEDKPGEWLTVRDVVEAVGHEWVSPTAASAAKVRRHLGKLETLGLAESTPAGQGKTYRAVEVNT